MLKSCSATLDHLNGGWKKPILLLIIILKFWTHNAEYQLYKYNEYQLIYHEKTKQNDPK